MQPSSSTRATIVSAENQNGATIVKATFFFCHYYIVWESNNAGEARGKSWNESLKSRWIPVGSCGYMSGTKRNILLRFLRRGHDDDGCSCNHRAVPPSDLYKTVALCDVADNKSSMAIFSITVSNSSTETFMANALSHRTRFVVLLVGVRIHVLVRYYDRIGSIDTKCHCLPWHERILHFFQNGEILPRQKMQLQIP